MAEADGAVSRRAGDTADGVLAGDGGLDVAVLQDVVGMAEVSDDTAESLASGDGAVESAGTDDATGARVERDAAERGVLAADNVGVDGTFLDHGTEIYTAYEAGSVDFGVDLGSVDVNVADGAAANLAYEETVRVLDGVEHGVDKVEIGDGAGLAALGGRSGTRYGGEEGIAVEKEIADGVAEAVERAGEVEFGECDRSAGSVDIGAEYVVGRGHEAHLLQAAHGRDDIGIGLGAVAFIEELDGEGVGGADVLIVLGGDNNHAGSGGEVGEVNGSECAESVVGSIDEEGLVLGVLADNYELLVVAGSTNAVAALNDGHILLLAVKVEDIGVECVGCGVDCGIVDELTEVECVEVVKRAVGVEERHEGVHVAVGLGFAVSLGGHIEVSVAVGDTVGSGGERQTSGSHGNGVLYLTCNQVGKIEDISGAGGASEHHLGVKTGNVGHEIAAVHFGCEAEQVLALCVGTLCRALVDVVEIGVRIGAYHLFLGDDEGGDVVGGVAAEGEVVAIGESADVEEETVGRGGSEGESRGGELHDVAAP